MEKLSEERYYTEFASACSRMIQEDCTKYFKRYDPELPRIIKALGMLKSVNPQSILDIGPGRGRALWPIAYNFPDTNICCLESVEWRCKVIDAVHKGGVERIQVVQGTITKTDFENNQFDVVTALEVMEHIPNITMALSEMIRVARRYIIASVPSKPDNNPDHVHFFSEDSFRTLLNQVGKNIGKLTFDYVRNSMMIFIRLEHGE